MANPADELPPDSGEEGGPVKSFLEHLEDLRWMLVKCLSTIVVGVIICLLAGKYLVAFMTWPLQNVTLFFAPESTSVPVLLGTNSIGTVDWKELNVPLGGTNPVTAVRLAPVLSGTNYVLALQPETRPLALGVQKLVVLKNYSPIERIMVALKLSIYGGMVLTAPLVILFIGQFVLPTLKVNEKRLLYRRWESGLACSWWGLRSVIFSCPSSHWEPPFSSPNGLALRRTNGGRTPISGS